ncbi:MAG: hypothetical protein HYU77_09225 [Betaproteobacteria bacterium]|nr:hypothetical protein [Betaproteobacteria bacterium]
MTTGSKLLIAVGIIVAVIAGAVAWLASSLDSIVESAIETFGPEITGVTVEIGGVSISATDGKGAIRGLVLGNPRGFKAPTALRLGEISLTVEPASLAGDVVVIKELVINAPEITYEKAGSTTNLDAIQRNVDRYVKAHSGPAEKKSGTRMIIENLYIRDGRITLTGGMLGESTMTTSLPMVHLRDVGKKSNGATAGEVTKQVMSAMVGGVTRAASSAAESVKKGAGSAADTVKGWFK